MSTKQTIAQLLVEIGVTDDDAAKAVEGFGDGVEDAEKKTVSFGKAAKQAAKVVAAFAAAVVAAAGAAFKLVNETTKFGDEIGKSAKKIGAGTTELQRLRFAADRSGASARNLDLAIKNSAKQLQDAANGGAKLFRDALGEVGLSIEDVQGLSAEDRIGLFADKLAGIEDQGKRTALAMNLFGARAGPELLPLLLEGSEGIAALGDEAERLGIVMGEDAVADSEAFQDTLTNAKAAVKGLTNTLGIELLPVVRSMIEGFTSWVEVNREMLRQDLARFFKGAVRAAKVLLPVVEALARGFLFLVENIDTLVALMAGAAIAKGFTAVAAGLKLVGVSAAGALGPIGLFIGGLTAATLAMRDFIDERGRLKVEGAIGDPLEDPGLRENASDAEREAYSEFQAAQGAESAAQTGGDLAAARARSVAAKSALSRARTDAVIAEIGQEKEARAGVQSSIIGTAAAVFKAARGGKFDAGVEAARKALKPKRKRSGGGGGRRSPKASPSTTGPAASGASIGDFLGADFEGLEGLAAETPSTAEIEPTVAIDITNNFNFEIAQTINGAGNAKQAAETSAKLVRAEFDRRMSNAGQRMAGNVVR
jgi:hypothetical protein